MITFSDEEIGVVVERQLEKLRLEDEHYWEDPVTISFFAETALQCMLNKADPSHTEAFGENAFIGTRNRIENMMTQRSYQRLYEYHMRRSLEYMTELQIIRGASIPQEGKGIVGEYAEVLDAIREREQNANVRPVC